MPKMAAGGGGVCGGVGHVATSSSDVALSLPRPPRGLPNVSLSAPRLRSLPSQPPARMAAPNGRSSSGAPGLRPWASLLLLLAAAAAAAGGSDGDRAVDFDGGHTCTFTYAAQGGTNEQWQMSLDLSDDSRLLTCIIWRPQGKSYLFFTQFKAEVQGAEVEYGMAYSTASTGKDADVPLKPEEFEVTSTAVTHRQGAFRAELSKIVLVARTGHVEL
ncbi:myeloid-derived growth factor isoform X2 [Phascolarctos cinereus]|uniref:Myeloid-derived growth factor isoform X2 n=1 Tax=Phascolarctos cinereus TaxID=38626 RepID=A0A6P5J7A5_PHACI|nr:myeloid-derived growth factor isoform X2 [Phascolarctos cinereus]